MRHLLWTPLRRTDPNQQLFNHCSSEFVEKLQQIQTPELNKGQKEVGPGTFQTQQQKKTAKISNTDLRSMIGSYSH